MHSVTRRQTLADLLHRSAARTPDKTAIVCGDTRWTYAEFDAHQRARRRRPRRARRRQGRPRRGAGAQLPCLRALRFALARLGAVLVPINFMLKAEEVAYILRHAGATMLATDSGLAALARAAAALDTAVRDLSGCRRKSPSEPRGRHDRASTQLAACETRAAGRRPRQRTIWRRSSTPAAPSPSPKGAMLTHEAVISQYVSCLVDAEIAARRPDAARAAALSLRAARRVPRSGDLCRRHQRHHRQADAGQPAAADRAPSHQLVLRAADGLDLAAALAAVRQHRPVAACARAITAPRSCRSKCCANWRSACPRCGCGTSTARPRSRRWRPMLGPEDQLRKPGSCGRAVLNVETRVVDDAMRDVAAGEVGEIVHRSPHLMTGLLPRRRAHAGGLRGRLVPLRRPRHHRRRGLHHRRRSQEGHDQDRRRERRQPRGRGNDLPPARRLRSRGDRRCRIRAGSRRWSRWSCSSQAMR